MPKIIYWYINKYGKKIESEIDRRDWKQFKIVLAERALLDELGKVYYTDGTETKELDYYNDQY